MILILGTTPDDILYYQNQMKITDKGIIRGNHPYYVGSFGGKEICLTYTGNTTILASAITSFMISTFEPYITISVGTVWGFSKGVNQGDLFIAERVYIGDTDFESFNNLIFSEAINIDSYYTSEDTYIRHLERLNSTSGNLVINRGPIISVNKFLKSRAEAQKIIDRQHNYLSGKTAFDSEVGGIAATCKFYRIPWLIVKAVSYEIGNEDQSINFVRKGLEVQPSIGYLLELLFDYLATTMEI